MTVDEALRGSIDSNVYFLSDPNAQVEQASREFRFALASPFMRDDGKRELRFFKLNITGIENSGEWDDEDNARFGWAIESVEFGPRILKFDGYEACLLIHLGEEVGAFAISHLSTWPEPSHSDFLTEISRLFSDPNLEWIDLMPCTTAHIITV